MNYKKKKNVYFLIELVQVFESDIYDNSAFLLTYVYAHAVGFYMAFILCIK